MKKTKAEDAAILEAPEVIEGPGEDTTEVLAGIADLKKKLEDLAAENTKTATENNKKLNEARAREAKLVEEADKAYKKMDLETFHKAQEELKLCQDAQKLYMGAIKRADFDPVITKEQFDDYFKQICEYLEDMIAEDRETLGELLAAIIYIRDREDKEMTAANKLIETMQKNLLKDPCGITNAGGIFVEIPSMVKKYKNTEVLEFCNFITSHPIIKELVEVDTAAQGIKRSWI